MLTTEQSVETISIVRIVLFVLANRFKNSVSFAQNDMKTPVWANMLKLLDIVEEFIFHTGFGKHAGLCNRTSTELSQQSLYRSRTSRFIYTLMELAKTKVSSIQLYSFLIKRLGWRTLTDISTPHYRYRWRSMETSFRRISHSFPILLPSSPLINRTMRGLSNIWL